MRVFPSGSCVITITFPYWFVQEGRKSMFNAASIDYGLNSESDPCLAAGSYLCTVASNISDGILMAYLLLLFSL
jgi:hypothetical protein